MSNQFTIACIQTAIRHVADPESAPAVIQDNVNRIIANIGYTVRRQGRPRIVVLPEFALTGFDPDRSIDDWTKIAIQVPGPETQALGAVAKQYGMYICFGSMEYDPAWPDRWFNSAFIIGPDGNVILRYKLHYAANVGGIGNCTSIGDVYSEYVRRYGTDDIFPVVETDAGNLAIVMGNDIGHPEVTRAVALKGAEIILRPTSGSWGADHEAQHAMKTARAFENMAYWAHAGHGIYLSRLDDGRYVDDGFPLFTDVQENDIIPLNRGMGPTGVWNYDGTCLAKIDTAGEATITAPVDLDELRAWRREPQALNFLARLRTGLFPGAYEATRAFPKDHWLATPIQKRAEGAAVSQQVVKDQLADGLILPPPATRAPFNAAVVQTRLHAIPSPAERDATLARNRDRVLEMLDATAANNRLVVLPEFWMQGTPNALTRPVWPDLCMEVPGPELAPVQEIARKHRTHIVGGALEKDGSGRWFNMGYLIGPDGEIALKYTNTHNASQRSPFGDSTRVDHLPRDFDWRSVFPVAETELGRIGLIVGFEVCLPEVTRALVLNGAEIICNVTCELQTQHGHSWQAARIARAYENHAYFLMANCGASSGSRLGESQYSGRSTIIDFNGRVLSEIDGPGEATISARLDITSLRRRRMNPRSYLAQMRPYLYPEVYRSVPGYPIHLPEGQGPADVPPGTYMTSLIEDYTARGIFRD